MAYNEQLADKIRTQISSHPAYSERKMFGGIGFMIAGNMACGVHGDGLMARVGKERYEEALTRPHVTQFMGSGRPMKGWIRLTAEGCADEPYLKKWVDDCLKIAEALPPK